MFLWWQADLLCDIQGVMLMYKVMQQKEVTECVEVVADKRVRECSYFMEK
jgi:hypothetical protein